MRTFRCQYIAPLRSVKAFFAENRDRLLSLLSDRLRNPEQQIQYSETAIIFLYLLHKLEDQRALRPLVKFIYGVARLLIFRYWSSLREWHGRPAREKPRARCAYHFKSICKAGMPVLIFRTKLLRACSPTTDETPIHSP
jgi:hypothetical protein